MTQQVSVLSFCKRECGYTALLAILSQQEGEITFLKCMKHHLRAKKSNSHINFECAQNVIVEEEITLPMGWWLCVA